MEFKTLHIPILVERSEPPGARPDHWRPVPIARNALSDSAEHLDPDLWDSLFQAVQLRVLHIAD